MEFLFFLLSFLSANFVLFFFSMDFNNLLRNVLYALLFYLKDNRFFFLFVDKLTMIKLSSRKFNAVQDMILKE